MSAPKKSFGRHHTHFTHSSILVVLKEGKIDSVTMTNVGAQVLVADIGELAKLSTPEERTKLLTLGVATSKVGHEEFEHFLDSLVEAKTVETTEPTVEPVAEVEPVTPVPSPDVPVAAPPEPEPVVVPPVAPEPATPDVETLVAAIPAVA